MSLYERAMRVHQTMNDERVSRDPTDWGGRPEEREICIQMHETKEQVPPGQFIDATQPLTEVVDEILRRVRAPQVE